MKTEVFSKLVDNLLDNITLVEHPLSDVKMVQSLRRFIFEEPTFDNWFKALTELISLEWMHIKLMQPGFEKGYTYADYLRHRTKEVLCKKEKEYAEENDRLSMFKNAYYLDSNYSPKEYCYMWGMKHLTSIFETFYCSKKEVDLVWISEKYGDAINYLFLVLGVMIDTQEVVIKMQADINPVLYLSTKY